MDNQLISEKLKELGKLKLKKLRDPLDSFRFGMARGLNRKNLRQVPDVHSAHRSYDTLAGFIRGLDTSNKAVDIAKKAPSGVWRISKKQVLDISKKYKFNIPDQDKPMKHLGSTGIQLIRFKPGIYYLYKPHRKKYRRRKRFTNPFRRGSQTLIKGITG